MTAPVIVVGGLAGPHAAALPSLEAAGCLIDRLPADARRWDEALLAAHAARADIFLGTFGGIGLPRAAIARAPRLKAIVSPVIGTEHIDVAAATALGVVVAHGAMAENGDGMAEAGAMLAAALLKDLPGKTRSFAAGRWKPAPAGRLVRDATIGLVGFGRIGQGVARRLAGWGCRRIAHDPYVDPATADALGVALLPLDTVLAEADVLLVLVTLSPETRHLIDAVAIGRMKPGAALINIGRGGCVDEAALAAALDEGRLSGAAIDTWEVEPTPADHPLRDHPRVIGTAHVVGHSAELYAAIPRVAAENVLRALAGEVPAHVRDPSVLPAWRARLAAMAEGNGR